VTENKSWLNMAKAAVYPRKRNYNIGMDIVGGFNMQRVEIPAPEVDILKGKPEVFLISARYPHKEPIYPIIRWSPVFQGNCPCMAIVCPFTIQVGAIPMVHDGILVWCVMAESRS
jgi:hypothetical protein